MSCKEKLKAKIVIWIIEAFTNEKYHFRRALLIPQINKWLKENWWQEEGKNMNDSKKWFQSRTVWVAIIAGLIGMIHPVSSAIGTPIEVPNWVLEVLAGLGLYSLRAGQGKPLE